jgi:hypothetical protein
VKTLLIAGRVLLALVLVHGAVVLLHHPRLPGYDSTVPGALLAVAEIGAAVLFAIPRTAFAGGLALLLVLAWAAGFHAGVREPAYVLFLWMTLVSVLTFGARAQRTA